MMDWEVHETRPNKIQFINAGFGNAFDTNFCITFSIIKPYQDIINKQIKDKTISVYRLKWLSDNNYLDKDGNVNFSVRYTGTMADTTIYGNTQWNVCNAIYAYGLIPESMHPNVADNWNDYASEDKITTGMKWLGAEFLKRFDLGDFDATLDDLERSPLQAIVRFADGDGILSPIGKTNHGVVVNSKEENYANISDSYWQEHKKYALDKIFYLKGFTVKEKIMTNEQFAINNEKKIIFEGVGAGRFGIIIGGKLREITPERSAQACLYALTNARSFPLGVTVQTDLFDSLPKGPNF
jgi:hypothetical protein